MATGKCFIVFYLVFIANLHFLHNTVNGYGSAFLAFAAGIETEDGNNGNKKDDFFHDLIFIVTQK